MQKKNCWAYKFRKCCKNNVKNVEWGDLKNVESGDVKNVEQKNNENKKRSEKKKKRKNLMKEPINIFSFLRGVLEKEGQGGGS